MNTFKKIKFERDVARRAFPPGDIEVFENNDWNTNDPGWHFRTGLDVTYIGDDINDEASSVIIYSGTWELFEGTGYIDRSVTLGPGYYGSLEAAGLCNDCLSSFRQIA